MLSLSASRAWWRLILSYSTWMASQMLISSVSLIFVFLCLIFNYRDIKNLWGSALQIKVVLRADILGSTYDKVAVISGMDGFIYVS